MKTKKIIFFVIIFIFIIALGFFLWKAFKEESIPSNINSNTAFSDEYIEREINGEKIIEHKETKFEMRIPNNWDMTNNVGEWGIICTSPDFELHEEAGPYSPPIPKKGCSVSIDILKENSSTSEEDTYSYYVQKNIDWCLVNKSECDEEVVIVDDNNAIRHTYYPDNDKLVPGYYVKFSIPKGRILYEIESYFFGQDRKKCTQEFEEILKTVKIGG